MLCSDASNVANIILLLNPIVFALVLVVNALLLGGLKLKAANLGCRLVLSILRIACESSVFNRLLIMLFLVSNTRLLSSGLFWDLCVGSSSRNSTRVLS